MIDEMREDGWEIVSGAGKGPIVTLTRRFGDVSVSATMIPRDPDMELRRLRADPPRSGGGKTALAAITNVADQTRTSLILKVEPFGSKAMNEAQLRSLYGSFGFEPDPYGSDPSSMIRHPAPEPEPDDPAP